MKLKTPVIDFAARVIENRTERKISYIEYEGYRERYKDYDFVYDEISHSIYTNGSFSRRIDELSRLASIIRYFAESRHPSSSSEIADSVYGSSSDNKASLARQRVQDLRDIHHDLIIKVPPYRRFVLNSELNTLFILSD